MAHLLGEHVRYAHHHNVGAGGRLSHDTINRHGRVLRAFNAWLAREDHTAQHVLARFIPLRPQTKPIVPFTPQEFRGPWLPSRGRPAYGCGRAILHLLLVAASCASELAEFPTGDDLDLKGGS